MLIVMQVFYYRRVFTFLCIFYSKMHDFFTKVKNQDKPVATQMKALGALQPNTAIKTISGMVLYELWQNKANFLSTIH